MTHRIEFITEAVEDFGRLDGSVRSMNIYPETSWKTSLTNINEMKQEKG